MIDTQDERVSVWYETSICGILKDVAQYCLRYAFVLYTAKV